MLRCFPDACQQVEFIVRGHGGKRDDEHECVLSQARGDGRRKVRPILCSGGSKVAGDILNPCLKQTAHPARRNP